MPIFNAEKLIAELKTESKQTELDLSYYTKQDEKLNKEAFVANNRYVEELAVVCNIEVRYE